MSTTLWFARCAQEHYASLQAEVESRDAQARLLRLCNDDVLIHMVGELARATGTCNACLYEETDENVEPLVAQLARAGALVQIICFVSNLDPEHIARLFQSGATEVIATSGAEVPQPRSQGRRVERTSPVDAMQCSGVDDDSVYGGQRCDVRAAPAPQPAVPVSMTREPPMAPLDDLDEPEAAGGGAYGRILERAPRKAEAPTANTPAQKLAPVVVAVAGSGGSGKTTLLAALATFAARAGLHTALLDLDLMFGDACSLLGSEEPGDIGLLVEPAQRGTLREDDVVRASARVAPGLTVWGPMAAPERAELATPGVERLIDVLQRESDIIFVDTSTHWSDAVAATVATCDRCLVVGSHAASSIPSTKRVIELVQRMGVARTRMVGVLNRFGAEGCGEEYALRFEMSCALSAKARIADGGREINDLASFGQLPQALERQTPFARSVDDFALQLLKELGCPVVGERASSQPASAAASRRRLRLPWNKRSGDAA